MIAHVTYAQAPLQIAFSGVTDAYGKDSEHQQRLKDICRSIVCMLRTWSGMFYPVTRFDYTPTYQVSRSYVFLHG